MLYGYQHGILQGPSLGFWNTCYRRPDSPEERVEAYRRLGEWWRWKQYYARYDRCCHGKR